MINLGKKSLIINILKARLWLGFLILIIILFGCEYGQKVISITGTTMGTSYSIKIIDNNLLVNDENNLRHQIDSLLVDINRQMSHYIPDSEISLFNKHKSVLSFAVSSDFFKVVNKSQEISQLTGGAFDVTIAPLTNYWGFGPAESSVVDNLPESSTVFKLKQQTGYQLLAAQDGALIKKHPDLTIDLSAIAKGYGVDAVHNHLIYIGLDNVLVEIGGEVHCSGVNANGKSWNVGIDTPQLNGTPGANLHSIIQVNDEAVATSGDYRNFVIIDGKIYSHVIDPRSGFPTENQVASATIVTKSCVEADALATAVMILGEIEGLKLINSLPDAEAMLIIRIDKNEYRVTATDGMKERYVKETMIN
ncbi:FAD:protein FMN transferase [Candidatus Neomarinimicrobiota bacterium]